jgi:hypothetical protein
MGFLVRLFCCIFILGISLFAYVSKHNVLTEKRMRVPLLAKELQAVDEQNVRLRFSIEKFESPLHLMELVRKPEFSHLKHPVWTDIIVVGKEEEDAQKP